VSVAGAWVGERSGEREREGRGGEERGGEGPQAEYTVGLLLFLSPSPLSPSLPLSPLCSLVVLLCARTQFHTLSAVDKGQHGADRPRRGVACAGSMAENRISLKTMRSICTVELDERTLFR
jgi:hypothetical protein